MSEKRLRLLHLVASSRGGGAAHVRDLVLGLDASIFDVHVAMPEDGGSVGREDFVPAGIPFHPVKVASGFSLPALMDVRRLAADVDILHVHGARAALFGRLAAASLGHTRPRIVYTIHGFAAPYYPAPRRNVLLGVERLLAPITGRYIAVCRAEREAFLASGVTRPEKVQVVHNGIRAGRLAAQIVDRASLGVSPATFLITTICRLYKPRDFDTLLRAFQKTAQTFPNAHLLIVGDGPLRSDIQGMVQTLSLAGRVTLTGWRDDVAAIYAASDVFTLTTWGWEGLPLTVLEAMAAGLPVVATRAGGMPEAIIHNETGLLVDRGDANQMAGAFSRLQHDVDLRKRMGEAGRKRVQSTFTLEAMVAQTAGVYVALLQDGRRSV